LFPVLLESYPQKSLRIPMSWSVSL
jgi:hypothetical protein